MNIDLILTVNSNINFYNSVNVTLDMEEYLKGVVPAEIGNAQLEACKAQAVASRTVALIRHNSNKQIGDTSSTCQAFLANRISSSYANALLAVEETVGEVLYYDDQLINTCPYSNSNGGRIKSSKEKWGGERAWLQAKDDPYDSKKGGGHGVGMSQTGAIEMARQGFNYKEILSFYYPGTIIKSGYGKGAMPMSKADQVVSWARSKVGCGYVWGATGQKATEANVQALIAKHGSNINYDIVKKWISKGVQIYDCAGFVAEAMRHGAGISMATGATSAWKNTKWAQSGSIDTLPVDKVCCLYRRVQENPVKMQHTGVYLGDGTFIDSRGSSEGVIGPNKMSSYKWTHWGIPEGLYDGNEKSQDAEVIKVAYRAKIIAQSGSTVNMRTGPSTSNSVIAAIGLGQIVDVVEENGEWSKIMWNGKTGYMMSKFLTKIDGSESSGVWYVRLECDSEAQAKSIAQILSKAKATN